MKPSNLPKVVEAATLAMEDPVAALAYSRDGNKLYAVSNAALLTMSASTDNRVISRVALRIDDPRTATGELKLTNSEDLLLQRYTEVWRIKPATGVVEKVYHSLLRPGERTSEVVAISADGTREVTDNVALVNNATEISLELWDVEARRKLFERKGETVSISSFSPIDNSALLAYGSTIVVVDDGGAIRQIEHTHSLMDVEADWLGERVFINDGAGGLAAYSFDGKALWKHSPGWQVQAVGPRSDVLATVHGTRVMLLETATGREVKSVEVRGKWVNAISFHPVEKRFAIGTDAGLFVSTY